MQFFDLVLKYFYEISAIPRPSYHEDKIADYLVEFAHKNGLESLRDSAHNVLIRKPASPDETDAPAVLLQGHTDMVCEKNGDCNHDFSTEGIKILQDGDLLYADGTTLGADNGYAVATMLAILSDDTLSHPALECLFTSAEEVGLDGMRAVDPAWLNARLMINLDSCDEHSATAACAGGVRTNFDKNVSSVPYTGEAVRVFITGLCGGHSGEDIDRCRANALKIGARLYCSLSDISGVHLISIHGGNKDNAIPRECEMVIATEDPSGVIHRIERMTAVIAAELCRDDATFRVDTSVTNFTGDRMSDADEDLLMSLLRIVPCGPLAMSADLPGLVETSSNTAVVDADAHHAHLTVSSRSSVESKLDDVCGIMEQCGAVCGFSVTHKSRYPGWQFRTDSAIQAIYKESSKACFGEEGKIIGIHAGLECGLLSKKIPKMDMISIGPNMYDIHTPKERLSLSSASRVCDLVLDMLKRIH